MIDKSVNVVALVRGRERVVFLFDEDSYAATLQKLGQFAADPTLDFTWYDAAVLSQRVRRLREQSGSL